MYNFNNFDNLIFITAKSFDQLKQKLNEIKVPVSLIHIDQKPTGLFYAFLSADRPVKQVSQPKKAKE